MSPRLAETARVVGQEVQEVQEALGVPLDFLDFLHSPHPVEHEMGRQGAQEPPWSVVTLRKKRIRRKKPPNSDPLFACFASFANHQPREGTMSTTTTIKVCSIVEPVTGAVHLEDLEAGTGHSLCGIPTSYDWPIGRADRYTCVWCEQSLALSKSMLADADRDHPHQAAMRLRSVAMAALAAAAIIDPVPDPADILADNEAAYRTWLAGFQAEMYDVKGTDQ